MSGLLTHCLRTTTQPDFQEDWARQRRTAADIFERLKTQEGVILADQVGMGKTYVALAVAVSEILSTPEREQVVIFVPAAVADKWVREWRKFSESLLEPGIGIRCVDQPVRSGEEFLKKLDDSSENREHLIVVTHTALTATLKDSFIQLALLYYATRGEEDRTSLRQRIAKWSTGRTGLICCPEFTPDRVDKLLETAPSKWRETWMRLSGEALPDDPVPEAIKNAASNLRLDELRAVIKEIPAKSSAEIRRRLEKARKSLAEATQSTWKWMLSSIDLDLPLLIVDEAHRLKNPRTLISNLFGERSGATDSGAFHGIFGRMLFLTATPFELGHSELIEVLSRMGAIRPLAPPPARSLKERLDELKKVLTNAQASALALDGAWGRLAHDDLVEFDAWEPGKPCPVEISAAAREAWGHANLAVLARHEMHAALKPWVIRHERPRRRNYHAGAAITSNGGAASGACRFRRVPLFRSCSPRARSPSRSMRRTLALYLPTASHPPTRRLCAWTLGMRTKDATVTWRTRIGKSLRRRTQQRQTIRRKLRSAGTEAKSIRLYRTLRCARRTRNYGPRWRRPPSFGSKAISASSFAGSLRPERLSSTHWRSESMNSFLSAHRQRLLRLQSRIPGLNSIGFLIASSDATPRPTSEFGNSSGARLANLLDDTRTLSSSLSKLPFDTYEPLATSSATPR